MAGELIPAPGRSAPAPATPAARQLAHVTSGPSGDLVRLPPLYARAAIGRYLEWQRVWHKVFEGPGEVCGRRLGEHEWAVVLPATKEAAAVLAGRAFRARYEGEDRLVCVVPKGTLGVPARNRRELLRALESVKPEELDEGGLPHAWVQPIAWQQGGGPQRGRDDDVTVVPAAQPLPAEPARVEAAPGPIARAEIRRLFEELCDKAGLAAPELVVHRGTVERRGFVTGRVFLGADGAARRVVVTTCPNSDHAEILATLAHELAHPLSRTLDHGAAFKHALLSLAERAWGPAFFVEARARSTESFHVVDAWVTCGVRAALQGREPPAPRTGDDGHTARIVSRIGKLRALAADQAGRPEAVQATGAANDLVTIYGVEGCDTRLDHRIDEQMIDRWVPLPRSAVWRRHLAHDVAEFCNVFSLGMASHARMHFFGRLSDVVAAEYLCGVSAERIERECAAHLQRWKALRRTAPTAGETRAEAVSFCDSAALAFGQKLRRVRSDEVSRAKAAPDSTEARAFRLVEDALRRAEDFARAEHDKRGLSWGTGGAKSVRHNEAGHAAGKALQIVRGLDSSGAAPRALPGRR